MVYVLYSLLGWIVVGENPFLGPRVVVFGFFLLTIGIVVSIVRALVPLRYAWLWGLLLACSLSIVPDWILQIRGDFPGISFSLLAIRLLLSRGRWSVPLAGFCAGMATQFKFTFVAALAAGCLWLLLRRRWKDAAVFTATGVALTGSLYLFWVVREPRMLPQITVLRNPILDVAGCLEFVYHTLREPVVLLAAAGLPAAWRLGGRWTAVMVFAVISYIIATATDMQAGGNLNYYFEALFALVPIAVVGVLQLTDRRQRAGVAAFTAVVLAFYMVPRARDLYTSVRTRLGSDSVESSNATFREFERILHGRHIFATASRPALFDPEPALTEPFLLSNLELKGFNSRPIVEPVQKGAFDVVITYSRRTSYRGVPILAPDVDRAISAAYRPVCDILRYRVYLPREVRAGTAALATELPQIGCSAPSPEETGRIER
jgi:hypothetical protein